MMQHIYLVNVCLLADLDQFRVFVEAVFYVGKGTNGRSMSHMKDAKDCIRNKRPQEVICKYNGA